ncbi:MAG: protein kinase [Gemmatimonadota bacterium]
MSEAADMLKTLQTGLADQYAVEREVGRGGMAIVYLARDHRHRRRVALKVLLPELASAVGAQRFQREVRAAARLVHPNILPLYDSGATSGLLYYVMPFVEGESLAERLSRAGPLTATEAARIGCAIADALACAHRLGIVHRDVKPANVLLSADDHPSLADFGLAFSEHGVANPRLTVTGVMLGSPPYMSPEQIKGAGSVDGRADVYSLGCVLFEMLSGVAPFSGPSIQSVLHGHLLQPPPSLSRLRPDVPAAIGGLVARMMEKNAERRPSADEVATGLRGWMHGGYTAGGAASPGRAEKPDPLPPSLRVPATLVESSVAVLPFRNISIDPELAYISDGITEELINTLGRLEGIRVAARTSVYAFREAPLTISQIGQRLDVTAVLEGSVQQSGRRLRVAVQLNSSDDGFQRWAASFDGTVDDVFGLQEEIARDVATALLGKLDQGSERLLQERSTDQSAAYNHYLLGRHHWHGRTPDGLTRAVEHFTQATELDPRYAGAYAGIADAYVAMAQFQYRDPHDVIPLAEVAARRALDLDPSRAEAHSTFAHILDSYHRDWTAAEQEYRRAIRLDPRFAHARLWLGDLLTALGRFDEALALGESALQLEPFAVATRFGYGVQLYRNRRYEQAIEELRRTMEMEPRYFSAPVFIAFAHSAAGEPERGVDLLQKVIARADPPHPVLIATLGFCQGLGGEASAARESLARIEAIEARVFVPAVNRLLIHAALGDDDRAFELMRKAVEERYGQFIFVAVDPAFDSLRGDGRFPEILELMGLQDVAPAAGAAA